MKADLSFHSAGNQKKEINMKKVLSFCKREERQRYILQLQIQTYQHKQ